MYIKKITGVHHMMRSRNLFIDVNLILLQYGCKSSAWG